MYIHTFCFVLSSAETWTPWTDKNHQYHTLFIPKGSLWGLIQKCDFPMKSLPSAESWHQSCHLSGLHKSSVGLRSTRDYILSRMKIKIFFSSKLKISNRPCNCLDFSNRKLLSISISLIIIDNLDLFKVDPSKLSIWEPWRCLSWPDRELLYSGYIYKRLYNNKSAYFTMLNGKKKQDKRIYQGEKLYKIILKIKNHIKNRHTKKY